MEDEMCPYCGGNIADDPCKSCGDSYCSVCISEEGTCPNCDGRAAEDMK